MQEPLRIGLLTTEYPGQSSVGGVWSYTRELALGLLEIGHLPTILVPAEQPLATEMVVPVHAIQVSRSLRKLPFPIGRGPSIAFAQQVLSAARELQLNVLEIPEGLGLATFVSVLKPAELRMVVRVHGADSLLRDPADPDSGRRRWREKVLETLVKRSIEAADEVSVPSGEAWQTVRKSLGIRRTEVSIVPCPVSDVFFHSQHASSSDSTLLCVGRLGWVKGDDVLVKAMPAILQDCPAARLRFAGEAHDTISVQLCSSLPRAVADRIEFLGQVSQEQILGLLQRATVCVFPSRWESFGIACAEAMAAGCPAVASTAPGLQSLVKDGVTGLQVPIEDPAAIAEATVRLLQDEALRLRLAQAGREHVRALCDRRRVATGAADLYRRVADRVRSPRAAMGVNDSGD